VISGVHVLLNATTGSILRITMIN